MQKETSREQTWARYYGGPESPAFGALPPDGWSDLPSDLLLVPTQDLPSEMRELLAHFEAAYKQVSDLTRLVGELEAQLRQAEHKQAEFHNELQAQLRQAKLK